MNSNRRDSSQTGTPSSVEANTVNRSAGTPSSTSSQTDDFSSSQMPSISLPKGGGAIRGIGEKFSANPVTGSGSIEVPVATSPGRDGFGPQLSLSYDSGSGNSVFGFGWSLSLPAISRKTSKGIPKYNDANESDVFLLSGSDDLVPVTGPQGNRFEDGNTVPQYVIHRYRPRVEGLFAQIERWTRRTDGDVHWRSVSKENILTIYGQDDESRIVDPTDSSRTYKWLICETRDDRGNVILYHYKKEDGTGVDTSKPHERNRGGPADLRRTANRFLKSVRYGNTTPLLTNDGTRPHFLSDLSATKLQANRWLFEVILDYGEHDTNAPKPNDSGDWQIRSDPFSDYLSGFEVRTTRLCQRLLMFHHFPGEASVGDDCLVKSTDLTYSHQENPTDAKKPVYTFLNRAVHSAYRRNGNGYKKHGLPPVEFEYSKAVVQNQVEEVDANLLENLPMGVDDTVYQWIDLHGEGIPGILTEQAESWFYRRNTSPLFEQTVSFDPLERVSQKPATSLEQGAQFLDLAGDGQPDVVVMDGATPGFYEHDGGDSWQNHQPFRAHLNRTTRDPNLKFVDLTGDGLADVLVSEDESLVWYASLGEHGFDVAQRVAQAIDEEEGPQVVFSEVGQSFFLADMSGDGLRDIVRVRNGEVCYWANIGYGRFGAKVTMDNGPLFDHADQYDHQRIRLADIDGSGTTDIIYLHSDGIRLYFNQSGNGWSQPEALLAFPNVDDLTNVATVDLLGNGTACLVWSSPLPGNEGRTMRYVNLVGRQKPHLLTKLQNNLGAESRFQYASSTKFYLIDKRNGKPWITRLPFPVHVLERVETIDHVSRNRFVSRYAYHHGHFDGVEREFRGFGMVEQWDTEEFAALSKSEFLPDAENIAYRSHVPPVLFKTWFHNGAYLDRHKVSRFYEEEYFREPGIDDTQFQDQLLPDSILSSGLTLDEEREACRALAGSMLRQEVFSLDGSDREPIPWTVAEQNAFVRVIQDRGNNRHAVFMAGPRESITYHYERNPDDPRVQHSLDLEVDNFGNSLQQIAIGYGRRQPDAEMLHPADQAPQLGTLISYSRNRFTNFVNDGDQLTRSFRAPQACETRSYELSGFELPAGSRRFRFEDWASDKFAALNTSEEISWEQKTDPTKNQKRLIEHSRILYRKDDLSGLATLGELESRALGGEAYQLALTPVLLTDVFRRGGQSLLPIQVENLLGGKAADQGGYTSSQFMKAQQLFPSADDDPHMTLSDRDGHWWVPSGQVRLSPGADNAAMEFSWARQHFFRAHRIRDPFHSNAKPVESLLTYDQYDLAVIETRDALGNTSTIGERLPSGQIGQSGFDYRILQPRLVTDPNGNRIAAAFDTLGMVVGTAMMGKPAPAASHGDSLNGFFEDLDQGEVDAFFVADDPVPIATEFLKDATSRFIYDLDRFHRTQKANPNTPSKWLPAYTANFVRETHTSDLSQGQDAKLQIAFEFSDGFQRNIQSKVRAEPGPVVDSGPVVASRWVSTGWTIVNNKGNPVRQYEPWFTESHDFEFGITAGVGSIILYDPIDRVIGTIFPNHTFEKIVFDAWKQVSWDVNDTTRVDLATDPDLRTFLFHSDNSERIPANEYSPSWHELRTDSSLTAQFTQQYPAATDRDEQTDAANKAFAHANTPGTVWLDSLGREFMSESHNKTVCAGHELDGVELRKRSRIELNFVGLPVTTRDAVIQNGDQAGREVVRYQYDLLGSQLSQTGMESGQRWVLRNVVGKPIRIWDGRGHRFRNAYDLLHRPLASFLQTGTDSERKIGETIYGESVANPETGNLRGQIVKAFDQAGTTTHVAYDFKGNLLGAERQFTSNYKTVTDWNAAVPLEQEKFAGQSRYDALDRPVQIVVPRSDQAGTRINFLQPSYNESGLLDQVNVWHNQNGLPIGLLDPATANLKSVVNIDYDAKGQRARIQYGNGVTTQYRHDPLTHLVIQITTHRAPADFDDCPKPAPAGWPGCQIQDLHYSYDAVGNVTRIRDDAQQQIFFQNKRVRPGNDFTYDANYQLVKATGREHLGQVGGAPIVHSHNDATRVGQLHRSDGNALGNYVEQFVYDAVGNILKMQHRGTLPVHSGWTRTYQYNEASLTEPTKQSNRLSGTTVGNETPLNEQYVHDEHGNITRAPHLGGNHPNQNMSWNFHDQLSEVDLGGGGKSYYVYDSSGQRIRKIREKNAGLIEERMYLGGFEIFRKHNGPIGNSQVTLERQTLHINDNQRRIGFVEARTTGNDPAPAQVVRYQFANDLGTAVLELDDQAQIISYEEYSPFGSTTLQSVRSQNETPKRYRYTGKERDEESGFYYHGARYYAPWLGRWTAPDPIGVVDGHNVYRYVKNAPTRLVDPNGTQSEDSADELIDLGTYEDGGIIYRRYATFAGDFVFEQAVGTTAPPPPPAPVKPPPPRPPPVAKPPAAAAAATRTAPDMPEPSYWEQAKDFIKNSPTAQFAIGAVHGGLVGAAPGGFIASGTAEVSGANDDLPAAYRIGFGVSEAAWGISQIITGAGGEAVGIGLDATGVGAIVGVPLNVAAAAVIVEGIADVGTGVSIAYRAASSPSTTSTSTPKSTSKHSKKLGKSLNDAGHKRPTKEHQAAHIVPTGEFSNRSAAVQKAIKTAQKKFDKYLGTAARDTPINGFWARAGHAGTHTDDFFIKLGKEFKSVNDEASAKRALQTIWKQIERGDFIK